MFLEGLKLEKAIELFQIDFNNKCVLALVHLLVVLEIPP